MSNKNLDESNNHNKNISDKPYYHFGQVSNFKELTKFLNNLDEKVVNVDINGVVSTSIILNCFSHYLFRQVANHRNYKLDKTNSNVQLSLNDLTEEISPVFVKLGDIRKIVKGDYMFDGQFLIVLKNGIEIMIYSCDYWGECDEEDNDEVNSHEE